MIIRREQLKSLDTIPLNIFLDKIAAVAKEEIPEGRIDDAELRQFIRTGYQEAVAMRRKTEKDIATYILDKLKTEVNVR